MNELSHSPEATRAMASRFSKQVKAPCVILLEGGLGAGKTEWVRGFAEGYLGKKKALVSSPTYSVINMYGDAQKEICHVDLYRLKHSKDLESVGFWDLLERKNVIIVEWGERINVEWPNRLKIYRFTFEIIDEQTRKIVLESSTR